ncbi:hypothetical protein GHT06_021574 [Daphnia sinensis]|uniref:Uncharacterized protein n=1 Tax=Daphnia sinensis TaxID=1820382 RepID=A0AAD5PQW7_9CRUS|nr:hypothetical protein GHT06_021574 [Daphnia sinensis]
MQMMSERFQMSQNERTEVKRMSTFVAICHSEAFLKSRLSTIAPALDIHYLLLMKLYEKDDKSIAQAALKSILNHLWYLCEETVIFAVFDKKLSPFTRKSMVDKLLTFPRPESIPVGKPKFPADLINKSNVSDSLLSCIGPRSWLLFFLLKIDEELCDWMKAPVECWQHMVGYQKIESFIKTLEVVNDCAERGVKLMTDFKDVSNNEEQQQYIMQVVEAHRRNFPSFNKNNLSHINQISD